MCVGGVLSPVPVGSCPLPGQWEIRRSSDLGSLSFAGLSKAVAAVAHRCKIPQTDLSVGVLAVLVRGAHQPGAAALTLPGTILY